VVTRPIATLSVLPGAGSALLLGDLLGDLRTCERGEHDPRHTVGVARGERPVDKWK